MIDPTHSINQSGPGDFRRSPGQVNGKRNMAVRQMKTSPIDTLGWPRLMSVKITGLYLSLSPRTIYNAISKNAETPFPVKPKHYGKRVLFDKKDLDAWIKTLSQ